MTSWDGVTPVEQPSASGDFLLWWSNASSTGKPWQTILPEVGVRVR